MVINSRRRCVPGKVQNKNWQRELRACTTDNVVILGAAVCGIRMSATQEVRNTGMKLEYTTCWPLRMQVVPKQVPSADLMTLATASKILAVIQTT